MKTLKLVVATTLFVTAAFSCEKEKITEDSPAITNTSESVSVDDNSNSLQKDSYALSIAKSENGRVMRYEDSNNEISLSIANSGTVQIKTNSGSYSAEANEVENITEKMDDLSKQLIKRMAKLFKYHKKEDFSQQMVPLTIKENSVSPEGAIQLAFLNGSLSDIQRSVKLNRLGAKAEQCISISTNADAARAGAAACLDALGCLPNPGCLDTSDYPVFGGGPGVTICFGTC